MATPLEPPLSSDWRGESLPNTSAEETSPNWPALGAEIARNRFGTYVAARQWYATPAMFEPDTDALKLLLQSRTAGRHFRANHVVNPEKWLFLDTEATGSTEKASIGRCWRAGFE